ncbi:MAG: bifunctional metallophosphatase/5'-nucleotidase [Aequorivita sp.]|nr:bifunctional metallophosphatase/5'-nucleotidase [Aequorivita sp.]MAO48648.1 bifunctional metallophosphatase/5'-nucleotidase [Aequorivita sp.]MBF31713.1 bifunctional metallophosphatase/5'-nucleotidase [Aequorivita sp.]HAV55597.1 bifunctional metallophosphatase/5'-nucleotidase [Aequorivita sp.]HBL80938.1 bifunctional metallophosphatase/5'-nucleotidase [Aequorivita sp.]|tara:strand:+ start:52754 stop:54295 length:1542 start_codon:yes stop_codon:yes gene_type:complete
MRKFLLLAVVGYFFSSCEIFQQVYPEDPIKGAGAITLKIIQINDVYEIAPLNGGEYGGLARVAHIRDSIKDRFPNTYLFLAGDFLNPSLIGTLKVDGERVNGKQMIDVLNAMDIDLVTFGNHEFDLSEQDLQKRLNESNFTWTTANVRHVTEKGLVPFATKWEYSTVPTSDFSTFSAIDADGNKMKFGVFGVTLPSNPKDYVSYGDIYENAERAYDLAIKKADFVVGLTHVSLEEDIEIARRLRSLPLIMGGHEHYNMLEKEGRTIIAKADANAKSVYVHTLIYNLRTKYLHINSELMMVTDKIASSAKVERVVSKWTDLVNTRLKEVVENPQEVIYRATSPLDGTDKANRSKQTNVGELITRAMAYSYGNKVDGALVNGGSIRIDDRLVGDITSIDIFRVLPFGGSVLKVDLKGNLLKEVLEYGKMQSGEGAYLQRYNFSQDADGTWLVGGKSISDNKTYTVAFSDFLLKGLDIPFLTPQNKGIVKIYEPEDNETAADIRKAIIFYLNSQKK